MKKLASLMILIILALPIILAQEIITTKTNEKITFIYRLRNVESDTLKVCYPYFNADMKDKDWATFSPPTFDVNPNANLELSIVLDRPPVGYYQDSLQVSCERYLEGKYQGRFNILDPKSAPVYNVIVSLAGEGQDYFIKPTDNTYSFVAQEGQTKSVEIQIANTGTVPLLVDMTKSTVHAGSLTLEPNKFTLPVKEVQTIKLTYTSPAEFDQINESFTFLVGDYQETFYLKGDKNFGVQTIFAPTFSLFGEANVSGIKIPNLVIYVVLIGLIAYYFLIIEGKKPYMKKFKKSVSKYIHL
jgi:hypothetical protein